MSTSESGRTKVDSSSTQSGTKSIRGKIILNQLAKRKAKGEKNMVEFNARGQPVGQAAAEMQSYIGLLVRQHVKITFKSWKLVPKQTKDMLWEHVIIAFEVDKSWKSRCLQSANTKWRQWKSKLYKEYIRDKKNKPEELTDPPPCSGISREDWNIFVVSRLTNDFDKLSNEQKERAKKNLYPHRLSRTGYAGLAEKMKDKLCGEDDIDRAIMWKKARLPKSGEIEDEKLKKTMEKIDDCIRQRHEGVLNDDMLEEDLLSYALEKCEHTGRVRAAGSYITPSVFFKYPKEKRPEKRKNDDKKMTEMQKVIEQYAKMVNNLQERVSQLEGEKENGVDTEGKGSCSVKQPCVLIDEEIKLEKMNDENVENENENLKEKANENEKEDEDDVVFISKVDSVKGVARSLEFISPPLKKARHGVDNQRNFDGFDSLPSSLKGLYRYADKHLKDGKGIFMEFDYDTFGKPFEVYVHVEDIIPFCELKSISGNCIVIYIWILHERLKKSGMADRFCFVDPFEVSYHPKVKHETRLLALANRLENVPQNQLAICPCNIGKHWILTVLDPHKETIYLLDPLGHRIRDNAWQTVVNKAIYMFNSKLQKRGKKQPIWEIIKCPLQPDSEQCGYFVMRFMKDIIEDAIEKDAIFLRSLDNRTYAQKDIDEVRVECANVLMEHI